MMHSDTARAIARETGWDLDSFAQERGWSGVGIGPVGESRDSDALERSNWRTVYPDLVDRFGDKVECVTFGHWAVGWVAEIAHDTGDGETRHAVQEWRDRLDDYPVADESDYSDLEWQDDHPSDRECYSDDPDCRCPGARRQHLRKLIAGIAAR